MVKVVLSSVMIRHKCQQNIYENLLKDSIWLDFFFFFLMAGSKKKLSTSLDRVKPI